MSKGVIKVELNEDTKLYEVVSYVPAKTWGGKVDTVCRNFVSEHLCEASANRRAIQVAGMLGYEVKRDG